MAKTNEKIVNLLKKHPEGGEEFFNTLDMMLRGDLDILKQVYDYLMSEYRGSTVLVLTGKFGFSLFNKYSTPLMNLFKRVIIVEGGIRNSKEVETECSYTYQDSERVLIVDDSLYSGTTVETIFKSIGVPISRRRVFVVYDGSRDLIKDYRCDSMFRYYKK